MAIDAVTRLLPGALGDEDSAQQDSFVAGLLDWPQYTRPDELEAQPLPALHFDTLLERQGWAEAAARRPGVLRELREQVPFAFFFSDID